MVILITLVIEICEMNLFDGSWGSFFFYNYNEYLGDSDVWNLNLITYKNFIYKTLRIIRGRLGSS